GKRESVEPAWQLLIGVFGLQGDWLHRGSWSKVGPRGKREACLDERDRMNRLDYSTLVVTLWLPIRRSSELLPGLLQGKKIHLEICHLI
ncbi:hypothetical protein DPEC_G00320230, partial [Dallia pectoralis]